MNQERDELTASRNKGAVFRDSAFSFISKRMREREICMARFAANNANGDSARSDFLLLRKSSVQIRDSLLLSLYRYDNGSLVRDFDMAL